MATAANLGGAPVRLRFRRMGSALLPQGDESIEVVLEGEGTVSLYPSEGLRIRLEGAAERMEQGAVFWGASLFMVLGAVGGLLTARRGRRGIGLTLVGAAGAAALTAVSARRGAAALQHLFDTPLPARELSIILHRDDEMSLQVASVPWVATFLRFGPGEYDPAEARAFQDALHTVPSVPE